jgi:hypothetical protein
MFFVGGKRGETVRGGDRRQREGKTEPKGRGGKGGGGQTAIKRPFKA